MQKFAHDLRSIILPSYDDLLDRLLRFLPRPVSSAALTTLLATLSSLFKHLLVPATESDIVQRTWRCVSVVLPECNSEVQRAMAEVWGSLLRRLRASRREVAVEVMASDLGGVEDACAWAYIFACKVCTGVYLSGKSLMNYPRLVRVANTSYSYSIHSCTASPISP
jgi:U3 small nucleolar RNA-associated protein 20